MSLHGNLMSGIQFNLHHPAYPHTHVHVQLLSDTPESYKSVTKSNKDRRIIRIFSIHCYQSDCAVQSNNSVYLCALMTNTCRVKIGVPN